MDIKAAKTVAIVVIAFLVSYVPVIAHAASRQYSDSDPAWPDFLPIFCVFISSTTNPVIYCFRTRRFHSALKQFFKDPCGGTPFQETNGRGKMQQPVLLVSSKVYPNDETAEARNGITDKHEDEEVADKEKVAQSRRPRRGTARLSPCKTESGIAVEEAWVEYHHKADKDSQGVSWKEEKKVKLLSCIS